mgnify:CR=1 FL=1
MSASFPDYLFGVNYAWSHYGTTEQNHSVPPSFVAADLQLLAPNFNSLRVYSIHKWYTPLVLHYAKMYDMDVILEIAWVQGSTATNAQHIALFKYIMQKYPALQSAVKFIFIGHENMPATVAQSNDLLTAVSDMQTWVNQNWSAATKPTVTLDEQNGVWNSASGKPGYNVLTKLANDLPIFTNIYPYWADLDATQGTDAANTESFQAKWKRLMDNVKLGSRKVYIGETGWPTDGTGSSNPPSQNGDLTQSVEYWNFMFDWVQNDAPSNFAGIFCFEAFDEPFKSATSGSMDNHWGLYNSGSTLKKGITLPFSRKVTASGVGATPVNVVKITADVTTVNVYPGGGTTPVVFTKSEWQDSGSYGGYPFVAYGDKVELVTSSGAKASATLSSGDGIGLDGQMNLTWDNIDKSGISSANFADNGIWF